MTKTIDKPTLEDIIATADQLLAAIPDIRHHTDQGLITDVLDFHTQVDGLVQKADGPVVNREDMDLTGTWVLEAKPRWKEVDDGRVLTIRSEKHEKRGAHGELDDFRTTFSRAVKHVRRYAKGILEGKQRNYGIPAEDSWQQAVLSGTPAAPPQAHI